MPAGGCSGRTCPARRSGISCGTARASWPSFDGAGTAKQAEYSYYPGLDNPHALIVGSTQYFAHNDGLGNVIALTDTAKVLQRTYGFSPWGTLNGGTDVAGFAGKDRARFKGALWLGPEAEVYYMRARWYEPKTGRFLSEDPIGLAGGINLYAFAADDPVNGADPLGLDDDEEEETPCVQDPVVSIIPGTYNGASGDWYTCTSPDGSTYQVFVRYSDGKSPNSVTVSGAHPGPKLAGLGFGATGVLGYGFVASHGSYATQAAEGGLYFAKADAYGVGLGVAWEVTHSSRNAFAGHSHGLCGGIIVIGCFTTNRSGASTTFSWGLGLEGGLYWVESNTVLLATIRPRK